MKLIGISGASGPSGSFIRSGVDEAYVKSVIKAGGSPVILPICNDEQAIRKMISAVDGIIMSGGVDIHPSLYDEEISRYCGDFDVFRDDFEMKFIKIALELNKPILGICRGSQILNVYFGGKLYQELSLKENQYVMHSQKGSRGFGCHSIEVYEDTFLSSIYKSGDLVNSYHHQAVKELADEFKLVALSKDGIVEAYQSKTRPIYAVQFHPEVMTENDHKALQIFKNFIEEI